MAFRFHLSRRTLLGFNPSSSSTLIDLKNVAISLPSSDCHVPFAAHQSVGLFRYLSSWLVLSPHTIMAPTCDNLALFYPLSVASCACCLLWQTHTNGAHFVRFSLFASRLLPICFCAFSLCVCVPAIPYTKYMKMGRGVY